MLIRFDNLELTPCTINNTTEVNPRPMDDVQVQLVNGELIVYMRGTVGPNGELPGALIGFKLPVVNSVLGAQMIYSGLDCEIKSDEASLAVIRCVETDLKWCIAAASDPKNPIQNIVDGSAQKNNGAWEIYNDWVGKTGFAPGPFVPNQFNRIATRQARNPATQLFWFTSITDVGKTFNVPSTIPSVAIVKSTWGDTGWQFQLVFGRTGFATVVIRNASALFSDAPIPVGV